VETPFAEVPFAFASACSLASSLVAVLSPPVLVERAAELQLICEECVFREVRSVGAVEVVHDVVVVTLDRSHAEVVSLAPGVIEEAGGVALRTRSLSA
jgi:hypothetical protein